MTEQEAKQRWCPMVRISYSKEDAGGVNREADDVDVFECKASECMMWRFETLYGNMPSSGRIVEAGRSTENGYCGLAGKE